MVTVVPTGRPLLRRFHQNATSTRTSVPLYLVFGFGFATNREQEVIGWSASPLNPRDAMLDRSSMDESSGSREALDGQHGVTR